MSTDLVRYVCRLRDHVDASHDMAAPTVSPVTIHDGVWAFCPAGAQSEHVWEAIEPVTLATLRLTEAARPREAAAEESRS